MHDEGKQVTKKKTHQMRWGKGANSLTEGNETSETSNGKERIKNEGRREQNELTIYFVEERQELEMEVAELKMLRFSFGVTRMDKIRNDYIRGTAQVGKFGEKTREARLRWYGHLRRKDDGYIGRRMLRMELPGNRKRGRPKRRFMDVVKEDMAEVEVTEEDTVDRNNWRRKIRCGDP